ncbi:hypothetical protein GCM10009815_20120 [Nocardioides marmoribigeumensis]
MGEPGGGGAVWDQRNLVWRDADVLVAVTVAEIASPGVGRVLDEAAVLKIPDAVEGPPCLAAAVDRRERGRHPDGRQSQQDAGRGQALAGPPRVA